MVPSHRAGPVPVPGPGPGPMQCEWTIRGGVNYIHKRTNWYDQVLFKNHALIILKYISRLHIHEKHAWYFFHANK